MIGPACQIVGAACLVLGAALWSPILAVILAGLILIVFGVSLER